MAFFFHFFISTMKTTNSGGFFLKTEFHIQVNSDTISSVFCYYHVQPNFFFGMFPYSQKKEESFLCIKHINIYIMNGVNTSIKKIYK